MLLRALRYSILANVDTGNRRDQMFTCSVPCKMSLLVRLNFGIVEKEVGFCGLLAA